MAVERVQQQAANKDNDASVPQVVVQTPQVAEGVAEVVQTSEQQRTVRATVDEPLGTIADVPAPQGVDNIGEATRMHLRADRTAGEPFHPATFLRLPR